jgi:hypothetical protein
MIYGHALVRYFCSECNALPTETDKSIDLVQSSTECPKCGVLLLKSLKKALTSQQDSSNSAASLLFSPKFHTASRLRFDVEKIDSILTFGIGEHVCLVGNHSKILIERLCINALLSERHGGFGSSNVIIIDAGNSSDIYNCINFARQYGLDINDILKRIVVSRPFTIYQLANLVTCELPGAVRKFETKIIFIPDILRMFLEDPSVRIGEGLPIIKDITNSLRKLSDMSVIVSFICTSSSPYYRTLLARFDKYVQIANAEFDGRLFVEVGCHKKEDSKIIRLQQLDLEIIQRR